ncbi:MAG: GNAT family N-acetyltransferase [Anaerolineales bacterium]|nr:GNAT family N-acetyltransferase [Anaerolineales bacterium]
MEIKMTDDLITLLNAPSISNLRFRHYRGEGDLPKMVIALESSYDTDKVEQVYTLEEMKTSYAHLSNCDPYKDLIIAEIDGEVIGYSRGAWSMDENNGEYIYYFGGFLVPKWRRKGIGSVMLGWIENRIREIASSHPTDHDKFFQVFLSDTETARAAMLVKAGYSPIRYFHEMVRTSLEDIPAFALPDGLELRAVLPEHYRLIWDAAEEANMDHWGFSKSTEEDYQWWLSDKTYFRPHLWQVAWDVEKDQVAGQVRTFINDVENEKYSRKRGYTEFISVRRPWRKRGVARALIARSLQVQKEQGMIESGLGVDSENLSGATRIYEDCGFVVVKRNTIYRKPV